MLHADALQRAGKNASAIEELTPQLDALRASPNPDLLRALGVLAESEMMTGKPNDAIAFGNEIEIVSHHNDGEAGVFVQVTQ